MLQKQDKPIEEQGSVMGTHEEKKERNTTLVISFAVIAVIAVIIIIATI